MHLFAKRILNIKSLFKKQSSHSIQYRAIVAALFETHIKYGNTISGQNLEAFVLHKATKKLQSVTWPSNLIEFTRDQRTRTVVAFRFSDRFQSSAEAVVFRYAELLFRYIQNLHTNISTRFFYGFSVKWSGCFCGIQEAISGPEASSLTSILQSTPNLRENRSYIGRMKKVGYHEFLNMMSWK